MPHVRQQVYAMSLRQFLEYIAEQHRAVSALLREMEKVDQRIRELFQEELRIWQEHFAYCYPRLVAQREEMPLAFRQQIDQTIQEERERIRSEIAELDKAISTAQQELDAQVAKAQDAQKALRKANPELERVEEDLKAQIRKLQEEYARAFEEEEALRSQSFGWLRHRRQLRRLRRLQKLTKRQQNEALQNLRAVRQDWLTRLQQTADEQANLRTAWKKTSIEMAQNRARRDYLEAHLEELATEAGFKRVLEEMREAPDVPAEFGQHLQELARHNGIRAQYEKALETVSQAIGLLRGIATGLERFVGSVRQVYREQQRYQLSPIKVRVPQLAIRVNQLWPPLTDKIRDQDALSRDPLSLATIIQAQLNDPLDADTLQQYFEQMGNALSRATAAWS